jgi:hypothetical protein
MTCSTSCANRRFSFGSASSLLLAAALCLVTACVSSKYKHADKSTPPTQPLNVKFPPSTPDTSLYSEISDGGPGSWKREAFWDGYVVIMHNESDQALAFGRVAAPRAIVSATEPEVAASAGIGTTGAAAAATATTVALPVYGATVLDHQDAQQGSHQERIKSVPRAVPLEARSRRNAHRLFLLSDGSESTSPNRALDRTEIRGSERA